MIEWNNRSSSYTEWHSSSSTSWKPFPLSRITTIFNPPKLTHTINSRQAILFNSSQSSSPKPTYQVPLKHLATTEIALELNLPLPQTKISITNSSSQVRMTLLPFTPNLTELHHPKQNLNFQGLIIKTLVQCILIQVITKKLKSIIWKLSKFKKRQWAILKMRYGQSHKFKPFQTVITKPPILTKKIWTS